jgi:hypothetical protein
MKHAARASTLMLAGFLAMTSACVCAGGQGAGHGGSGGHGSSAHGGHSSRESSSRHASGQSIGHSFAHLFGHRGQGASAALTAIPLGHARVSALPGSVRRVSDRQLSDRFVFRGGTEPDSAIWSPTEPNTAYQGTISYATNETPNSSGSTTSSRNGVKAGSPITLLQLRDGSMYGLTDYWVEGGELHYRTTYGGENSLPFERIDFAKTVQLNTDRDVPFVLPPQGPR